MGTHPSGPSVLAETGESLHEWIRRNPDALGSTVRERFQDELPFLLKVLSVRTALSIQSHPDKALARKLHADRPDLYKDPNHKPEMAIALTEFEALCGFASFADISDAFDLFPEMGQCVKQATLKNIRTAANDTQSNLLKEVFTELMTCSEDIYSKAIDAFVRRVTETMDGRSDKEKLLLRLNEQYPQDIGVFAACFLNYVKLQPGEAMYLPANEPHAYLKGDIVECMATSDNVIRAGLTPKLRDTAVLCDSLSYTMGMPTVMEGESAEGGTTIYRPPFEEFEVRRITPPAQGLHTVASNQGPSLLLIQKGEGIMKQKSEMGEMIVGGKSGQVWFVPSTVSVEIERTEGGEEDLVLWQARVNESVFSAA